MGRRWLVFRQINVRTDRSVLGFKVVFRGVLVFQALPLCIHLLVLGGQGLVLVKGVGVGGEVLLLARSLL